MCACAAAPLYPADSMVGRLFRLAGTTWVSPQLYRDYGEETPGETATGSDSPSSGTALQRGETPPLLLPVWETARGTLGVVSPSNKGSVTRRRR